MNDKILLSRVVVFFFFFNFLTVHVPKQIWLSTTEHVKYVQNDEQWQLSFLTDGQRNNAFSEHCFPFSLSFFFIIILPKMKPVFQLCLSFFHSLFHNSLVFLVQHSTPNYLITLTHYSISCPLPVLDLLFNSRQGNTLHITKCRRRKSDRMKEEREEAFKHFLIFRPIRSEFYACVIFFTKKNYARLRLE